MTSNRSPHPPGVLILSISCSFWENLAKSYIGTGELVPPPRRKPGSATDDHPLTSNILFFEFSTRCKWDLVFVLEFAYSFDVVIRVRMPDNCLLVETGCNRTRFKRQCHRFCLERTNLGLLGG